MYVLIKIFIFLFAGLGLDQFKRFDPKVSVKIKRKIFCLKLNAQYL